MNENTTLPEPFQVNLWSNHTATQILLIDISAYYRNEILRAAARRAALFVIARYGEGDLAVFPRDITRLIAKAVWNTRGDDIWMDTNE